MSKDLVSVLRALATDWKVKQGKSAFDCAVLLERELDLGFESPEVRIYELEKALRSMVHAFYVDCLLPEDSVKSIAYHNAKRLLETSK